MIWFIRNKMEKVIQAEDQINKPKDNSTNCGYSFHSSKVVDLWTQWTAATTRFSAMLVWWLWRVSDSVRAEEYILIDISLISCSLGLTQKALPLPAMPKPPSLKWQRFEHVHPIRLFRYQSFNFFLLFLAFIRRQRKQTVKNTVSVVFPYEKEFNRVKEIEFFIDRY